MTKLPHVPQGTAGAGPVEHLSHMHVVGFAIDSRRWSHLVRWDSRFLRWQLLIFDGPPLRDLAGLLLQPLTAREATIAAAHELERHSFLVATPSRH